MYKIGQNFLQISFILQNSALSSAKRVSESSSFGKHDIKEILLFGQVPPEKVESLYARKSSI